MRYQPGHKEEKRKELLKATGRKVKVNGFAATGVDALAQAAGMTSGAFYSHFGSKSDWLKALINWPPAARCGPAIRTIRPKIGCASSWIATCALPT